MADDQNLPAAQRFLQSWIVHSCCADLPVPTHVWHQASELGNFVKLSNRGKAGPDPGDDTKAIRDAEEKGVFDKIAARPRKKFASGSEPTTAAPAFQYFPEGLFSRPG